ncbi:MAG TPA: helix-turn-helix domain-containing protein [Bryobacteraceae bacterium]|nr:helix-turn-helix domain-containing protein [Bryobacteraceae bacterium]
MPAHKPAPTPAPALDLRHARKQVGISLDQIAERTKISLRFLQAIEAEEFEKLPGGIFSTSYLRQYAAAIGYDEGALVDYYNLKMNPQAASLKERQVVKGGRNLLDRWLRMPAQASR